MFGGSQDSEQVLRVDHGGAGARCLPVYLLRCERDAYQGKGSTWLSYCRMKLGLRMSFAVGPGARSWPKEERGLESLLIYLLPWHSHGWELPPELGQMVFLGAGSISAASATRQERLHLSPTQEATRGGIWRS